MRRLGRCLWITAALLLIATAAVAAIPRFGIELHAPHTARRKAATLDKDLARAIEASLARATIGTVEEARDFALAVTDRMLHFGLEHETRMSFDSTPREANCIEYAHLFAYVFDMAAERARLPARAYVIHTEKARVFGQKVPLRGFDDHDWALIEDRSIGTGEARRLYVDPTLHDAGLGWDISASVRGNIQLPR